MGKEEGESPRTLASASSGVKIPWRRHLPTQEGKKNNAAIVPFVSRAKAIAGFHQLGLLAPLLSGGTVNLRESSKRI